MIRYDEKFIVINKKYLNNLSVEQQDSLGRLIAKSKMPCNHYFVVNHDEPYADIIWRTIQLGEELKTVTEPYRVFKERK